MKDTIMVRVPRTASSSMKQALEEAFAQDAAARFHGARLDEDCRMLMKRPQWPAAYTFGFVRNPWERLVSVYFFLFTDAAQRAIGVLAQQGAIDFDTAWRHERMWEERPPFSDWITGGFEHFHLMAKNQLDYLVDDQGKVAVSFIGRYENLDADFAKVCRDIGIPERPLAHHRNRTEHRPYPDYYTPAAVARVAEVYARDIDFFRYEFAT
jgi:hypothetical protein